MRPNRYLFDLPDGVRSRNPTDDVSGISSTEIRMIAPALATETCFYVVSPGQSEGHCESYAGTHAGPSAPAIYLVLLVNDEGLVTLKQCENWNQNHIRLNNNYRYKNNDDDDDRNDDDDDDTN